MADFVRRRSASSWSAALLSLQTAFAVPVFRVRPKLPFRRPATSSGRSRGGRPRTSFLQEEADTVLLSASAKRRKTRRTENGQCAALPRTLDALADPFPDLKTAIYVQCNVKIDPENVEESLSCAQTCPAQRYRLQTELRSRESRVLAGTSGLEQETEKEEYYDWLGEVWNHHASDGTIFGSSSVLPAQLADDVDESRSTSPSQKHHRRPGHYHKSADFNNDLALAETERRAIGDATTDQMSPAEVEALLDTGNKLIEDSKRKLKERISALDLAYK
ncbi:unnamed protein product, partial [Amoebophrya sp. A120]|eukprot:GSA120T00002174001.1